MPALPPLCFNAFARLVPALRATTARQLVEEGIAQDRIAEHLGVSQAMVSKYLRKPPRQTEVPSELVQALTKSAVRRVRADEDKGSVSAWCPVCVSVSSQGFGQAPVPFADLSECLRHEARNPAQAASQLLASLTEAEARLRRLPFKPLLPQVRSNLAAALPAAKTTREVASFPGRLVEIRGSVGAAAPPDFGTSAHLAQILLRVRRHHPEVAAILNVRYDETIRRAARATGLRIQPLKRVRNDLVLARPASTKAPDAVADPGAFGVEPALYLLGSSPLDVVQKASQLLADLGVHS